MIEAVLALVALNFVITVIGLIIVTDVLDKIWARLSTPTTSGEQEGGNK